METTEEESMEAGKPEKGKKLAVEHPCLQNKGTLRAFHNICLEEVKKRNATYLDQADLTVLLGGSSDVKPRVVERIMNAMLQMNLIEFYQTHEGKALIKPIQEDRGVDLNSLTADERLIYTKIQQAHNQGIWTQTLGKSLNIPSAVLNKCLRSLESRKIIKSVKSVKNPLRVIYMLYNLEPADDLTGGPWYNNETKSLDTEFVNVLLKVVYHYVHKRTFPPRAKIQTDRGVQDILRFYQPTYRGYATAEDVHQHIIKSEVLSEESLKATFGVSQVHKLLEVLCYQRKLQKRSDGVTYRSILDDEDILPLDEQEDYYEDEMVESEQAQAIFGHFGYTEGPCGRCPVFNECGNPGEDVSAATCLYWDEWTQRVSPDELF